MTAQGIVRRGERWPWWPALAALALLMLSLASFWPGVAMFDTVRQYEQVLSGRYNDWHPPVMARFWSLLLPLGRGTGPLFIAQLAAYWIGLGALAQALRGWKALAVLAIGASPVFLGWQIVVLKDAQMAGALVCATGLVAAFRLRGRRVPWPVIGVVALCLIYATLLRANAAFSTVPLTVLLAVPAGRRGIALAATLCGIPAAILASQIVNHAVLGARESGVSRSEAIYDLAAIAVRTGDAQASGIAPADIAALRDRHCVKPLFWDPMFVRQDCIAPVRALQRQETRRLYGQLGSAIMRHPLAYAAHRAGHLNATLRWLVPQHWPLAGPPAYAEPNDVGLPSPPCCATLDWQNIAGMTVETPIGWPVLWIVVGLWGLRIAAACRPGAARGIAIALIASALCQEASFAVLSLSSDLRYHLWPMLAVALGWVLIWQARPPRWRSDLALATLALLALSGLWARIVLPPSPVDYQELLSQAAWTFHVSRNGGYPAFSSRSRHSGPDPTPAISRFPALPESVARQV